MKKIAFLILVCFVGCKNPNVVPKSDYLRLKDSITILSTQNKESALNVLKLTDSIVYLNSSIVMIKEQHSQIVNYQRLLKYYKICKNNESQWKFYRGWSTRVFEQN